MTAILLELFKLEIAVLNIESNAAIYELVVLYPEWYKRVEVRIQLQKKNKQTNNELNSAANKIHRNVI